MGKGDNTSLDSFQVTHDPIPPDLCKDPAAKPHECHYYNLHDAPVIWARSTPSKHMFVYINGEEDPLKQYKLVPDTGPGAPGWKFESPAGPRKRFDPLKPVASSYRNPGTLDCKSAPYLKFPKRHMFDDVHTIWMPGGFLTLSANGDGDVTGIIWVTIPLAENANHGVVLGIFASIRRLRCFEGNLGQRTKHRSEQ